MRSYHSDRVIVHPGDCLAVLASLDAESIDAVVTDPPYHFASIISRFSKTSLSDDTQTSDRSRRGLDGYARSARGFMGKTWDGGQIAHDPATWAAVARVMKPGAHLVAFHAPKNWHRLACAIEDAGLEIRDNILWLFGSGFPKSHNIEKAIDKLNGAERQIISKGKPVKRMIPGADQNKIGWIKDNGREFVPTITAAGSQEAAEWEGWGTALKPAYEPIVLARKPLQSTVAANVMKHGTGAINIDGCRVAPTGERLGGGGEKAETAGKFTNNGWRRPWMDDPNQNVAFAAKVSANVDRASESGRWPANIVHDGSEEVVGAFPDSDSGDGVSDYRDVGSAARFFYSAKADASDRIGSKHPTVKPLDLMQWLVRLITPPRGLILDPFAGTGTTGEAALREGFRAILIEREAEYLADIERRMAHAFDGEVGRSVAMAKLQPEGEPLPLFAESAA